MGEPQRTDAELLDQLVATGDEAAFSALVQFGSASCRTRVLTAGGSPRKKSDAPPPCAGSNDSRLGGRLRRSEYAEPTDGRRTAAGTRRTIGRAATHGRRAP